MPIEMTVESNVQDVIRKFTDAPVLLNKRLTALGQQTAGHMETLMRRLTASWSASSKPEWTLRVHRSSFGSEIDIQISGEIYKFLDEGTQGGYQIPKIPGGKMLRFREGYKPKTRPGSLKTKSGGPYGGWVFRRQVIHPGIKARHFTEKLVKEGQKYMDKRVETIVRIFE